MNRSCSSAMIVLRSPQSTAAPGLGAAMFGQQPRRGVEIEVDAEHLSGPIDDRLPVLAQTIASDPLTQRFGSSAGQSRLARGTFQCSLETSSRASMEPAVNAARLYADERGNRFDRSAVL